MSEQLGTRDVLEQVDSRLSNVEKDLRALRDEMKSEIGGLRTEMKSEIGGLRFEMDGRFDRVQLEMGGLRADMVSQTRWLVGLMLASWLTLMVSIWLKS